MNKILICLMAMGIVYANALAQRQEKLVITDATVFLSGAELQSSVKITLDKGENEVVFINVAGNINTASLAVSATNDAVVTSATFQNNYLGTDSLSPRAKTLKDSIDVLSETLAGIDRRVKVLQAQLSIFAENQKIAGNNNGLSVAELTKMLDLINARMEGYMKQKHKEEKQFDRVNEQLIKLRRQLSEEQNKQRPGGQIVVKFYANNTTNSIISVDYVTPNAGWTPIYDVVARNTSSPITVYYKANIWQNSGVKWNNVHLTLSSGNPQQGMESPTLAPDYLSFYQPQPPANEQAYKITAYTKPLVDNDKSASNILTRADEMVGVDGTLSVQNSTSISNHVIVDNAGINTSFDIDLPYTIPADGQQHLVAIKKYELAATYRYYAVPKLDKDAFLQAEITNWQSLNLLPGKSNIFYENTYVGEGVIDVRNTRDTMTLSLGRDKKIIIKREQDVKRHSVSAIGANQKETFAYTLTARNTKSESIELMIQDQLPLSNDNNILVEDKNIPAADYEETTGALKWNITLKPNETKTISFGYTVRYPKGKVVNNL